MNSLHTLPILVFFLFILSGCVSPPAEEPSECVENWACNEWSGCASGWKTRECVDVNNCGTQTTRPAITDFCEETPALYCGDGVCSVSAFEDCQSCAQDCGMCEPIKPSNDMPVSTSVGTVQRVYEYVEEACTDMDLPDVYGHAFRDAEGTIVLANGNAPDNYWMFGTTFNNLERNCTPVLRSLDKWPVTDFGPHQWITSLYTEDGQTVYGIVHNEYHDPYSPKCKPGTTDSSNPCWYNFVSLAKSTNGGRTFTQANGAAKLIAILPFQWDVDAVPRGIPVAHGYFSPTNIVKKEDGYYYMLVQAIQSATDSADTGNCLMRTHNLDDPASWRFWDGTGFNLAPRNPYPTEPSNPDQYRCPYVSPHTIRSLAGSLTYNTYLEKYMLLGMDVFDDGAGTLKCGIYFSLSDDLITWGKPRLIKESQFGFPPCNQNPAYAGSQIKYEAYASLIDHDSTDRSFSTADNTAFIYYTEVRDNHNPGGWGLRRDMVRIPVTFTKE